MTFIKQCYISTVAQIKLEGFLKSQKVHYKNKWKTPSEHLPPHQQIPRRLFWFWFLALKGGCWGEIIISGKEFLRIKRRLFYFSFWFILSTFATHVFTQESKISKSPTWRVLLLSGVLLYLNIIVTFVNTVSSMRLYNVIFFLSLRLGFWWLFLFQVLPSSCKLTSSGSCPKLLGLGSFFLCDASLSNFLVSTLMLGSKPEVTLVSRAQSTG